MSDVSVLCTWLLKKPTHFLHTAQHWLKHSTTKKCFYQDVLRIHMAKDSHVVFMQVLNVLCESTEPHCTCSVMSGSSINVSHLCDCGFLVIFLVF